jgi:hypothetical protein
MTSSISRFPLTRRQTKIELADSSASLTEAKMELFD